MNIFPLLYETLRENYPDSLFSSENLDALHAAARETKTPRDAALVIATHVESARYVTVVDDDGHPCRITWASGTPVTLPTRIERTATGKNKLKFTEPTKDGAAWIWWPDKLNAEVVGEVGCEGVVRAPSEAGPDRWAHETPMEATGLALRSFASESWGTALEYVTVRSLTDSSGKPTLNERVDRIVNPVLEALGDRPREYMAMGMGLEDAVFDNAMEVPRQTMPFEVGEIAIAAYRDGGEVAAASVMSHYQRGYDTPARFAGGEGLPLDVFLANVRHALAADLSFGELLPILLRLKDLGGK